MISEQALGYLRPQPSVIRYFKNVTIQAQKCNELSFAHYYTNLKLYENINEVILHSQKQKVLIF